MTALLELDHVNKRFGGLQAVHDLSFTVHKGEILGLIGPNGAGKTTIFNLINGVHPPNSGRIVFDGTDITGEKPYRIARCGLARTHQIVQPLTSMTCWRTARSAPASAGRTCRWPGRARRRARRSRSSGSTTAGRCWRCI
jgi:ABC-type branched-subunit amino acid transport system ATPase component